MFVSKCGTTWTQYICVQLLSKGPPCVGRELGLSPTLEAHGVDTIERLDPPRLIKTHYEYAECPKSDKS
ncbi:Sulfotransferase domain containing protein, partial [Aphelenchoides avenae]